MAAPDFKATGAQGFQAVQDLTSHRSDWRHYQLDCATDILTLGSLATQGLLTNDATPGPVLSLPPQQHDEIKDALAIIEDIHTNAPVGSVLSETAKFFWAQIVKWLKSLGINV